MAWERIQTPQAQAYDLPFIGNDLAKVGRIIDLWNDPCSPDATIWVYGFFDQIPTLFITLTKPELIDINIRKGGHRRRKGKRARFLAQFVSRDALVNIPVPRWVVFRIYEWGQRIGWYFLVADAAEDFALNWLSMAYVYNGCVSPNIAYGKKVAGGVLQTSNPPTGRPLQWPTVALSQMNNGVSHFQPIKPGAYRANYSAFFAPYHVPSLSQLPTATWITADGVKVSDDLNDAIEGGQQFAGGGAFIKVDGPPYPVIRVMASYASGSKFCYLSGTFEVTRIESGQMGPDP